MASTDLTFSSAIQHQAWLSEQSAMPQGFRCGRESFSFIAEVTGQTAHMHLNVVALDQPTDKVAAMFTRNAFPGAPVLIGRQRLADQQAIQALVINNKISNVCAPDGVAAAEQVCQAVAEQLGCEPQAVIPSSTGVIGWSIPTAEMCAAAPAAVASLQDVTSTSALALAEGIMTTDLYPKLRSVSCGNGKIVAVAKGAGMVEPNLATMLVFIFTDVDIPQPALQTALQDAVEQSFNTISIDSDQSTSDTVIALSSGLAGKVSQDEFTTALTQVCADLAEDLVRNGEGVRHVMQVTVEGAPSASIARDIGKAVINSPLFKCAVAGNDPNVGRLIMSVGDFVGNHHPDLSLEHCRVTIGSEEVFAEGVFTLDQRTERQLQEIFTQAELYPSGSPNGQGVYEPGVDYPPHERIIPIHLDLGLGAERAVVIGGDLTHQYVSENADYRS